MSESVQTALESLRAAIHDLSEERRRGREPSQASRDGAHGTTPGNGAVSPAAAGVTIGDERRWEDLEENLATSIAGKRVLVVGCGQGHVAFAFAARGAEYVLACEPSEAISHAEVVESSRGSGVDFRRLTWDALDCEEHGRFDIVYCEGLLHRVPEPLTLLRALRAMITAGGTLLIGSMLLGDPERSECLRFVPDGYAGDPSWWFVPGRLAFRWLVEAAGFEPKAEFGEREGPRDCFPVVSAYLRAVADES